MGDSVEDSVILPGVVIDVASSWDASRELWVELSSPEDLDPGILRGMMKPLTATGVDMLGGVFFLVSGGVFFASPITASVREITT